MNNTDEFSDMPPLIDQEFALGFDDIEQFDFVNYQILLASLISGHTQEDADFQS